MGNIDSILLPFYVIYEAQAGLDLSFESNSVGTSTGGSFDIEGTDLSEYGKCSRDSCISKPHDYLFSYIWIKLYNLRIYLATMKGVKTYSSQNQKSHFY